MSQEGHRVLLPRGVRGFPVLDETFQATLPGLYVTGFAATRDFGPFFGFTRDCTAAATITVGAILTCP